MMLKKVLPVLTGFSTAGMAMAHGPHASAPMESVQHVLAHNWPVLLIVAMLGVASWLSARS